jgi:hypothetical protein
VNGASLERKAWQMHSTNVRQIKEALVAQAFHGTTHVSCPLGPVVAMSRWKGQLRVMIRGWGRWYPVESVRIEGAGVALLQEQVFLHLLLEEVSLRHLLTSRKGTGEFSSHCFRGME